MIDYYKSETQKFNNYLWATIKIRIKFLNDLQDNSFLIIFLKCSFVQH